MPVTIIELEEILNDLLPKRRSELINKSLLPAAIAWSEAIWHTALKAGSIPLSATEKEAAKNFIQNPVFICGVHRSGTTLVRDLLDDHPDLSVLPSEGTFITNIEPKLDLLPTEEQKKKLIATEWIRRIANPINQLPYWLLGRTSPETSPYVSFALFFNAWWHFLNDEVAVLHSFAPHLAIVLAYKSCTGNHKTRYWVDKTPTNEQHLWRLWQEFPSAKIIHVLRNPRNTLLSRKNMDPNPNMKKILQDMNTSFQLAARFTDEPDSRYMMVKYEELCKQPAQVTKHICSFLDIDFSESLLIPSVAGKPTISNSSFHPHHQAGFIHPDLDNAQQGSISRGEHDILATVLGKHSAKLGYKFQAVGKLRSFLLRTKYGIW